MQLKRFEGFFWGEERWFKSLISSPCGLLWPGRCWQYCSQTGYKSLWLGSPRSRSSRYFALVYMNRGLHSRKKRKKISWEVKKQAMFLPCTAFLRFLASFHFQLCWADICSGFLHNMCGMLWSGLFRPRPEHVISLATEFFLCHTFTFLMQIIIYLFLHVFHLNSCLLGTDTTNWFHVMHTAQSKYIYFRLWM